MSILYALDPAEAKPHALARFDARRLRKVGQFGFVDLAHELTSFNWPHRFVIESQERTHGAARVRDILALARATGEVCGMLRYLGTPFDLVLPFDWKRQIPKPSKRSDPYMVAERVKRELDEAELSIALDAVGALGDVGEQWDLWDAIGLGLVALERLRPGLV